MKKYYWAVTSTIAILLLCTSVAAAAIYNDWDQYEQQVFGLVNLQRNYHGLPALTADSRLQEAADLYSKNMALNDFFSHTSPDGTNPGDRITAQDYHWDSYGENIAAGYPDPHSVMYGTDSLNLLSDFSSELGHAGFSDWDDVGQGWTNEDWDAWYGYRSENGGWMGSAGHRENILYAGFTDIGVGYYYLAADTGANNYYHYWTQDFASGDTAGDPVPAPTPVPAAVWLLGSGLCGLVGFHRFRS
jgi:serralysin